MTKLTIGGLALRLAAAACDTTVSNPVPVQDEFLADRNASAAMVNGAGRALSAGMNWISYTGAAISREIHPAGSTGSFGISARWQNGELNADDGDLDTHWEQAQRARWLAEETLRRLEAAGPPQPGELQTPAAYANTLQLGYLYAGYANRLLGEVRLSHLQAHVEVTPVLTPQQRARYAELRGYAGSSTHQHHKH